MGVVKYLGFTEGQELTLDILPAAAPHVPLHTADGLTLPLPLDELRHELRRHGVSKASIFGSYARGEARADSDLDILVKLVPGATYFDLGGLQYTLEQKTGRKVDITTRLNKHFAAYAQQDMVEVLS